MLLFNSSVRIKFLHVFLIVLFFISIFWIILQLPNNFTHRTEKTKFINMKDLLCAGIYVSERGGEVVRQIRETRFKDLNVQSKGLTKEGVKELYTEADSESHKVMTYGLKKLFPVLTVISEEKTKPDDINKIPTAKKDSCNFPADIKDQLVISSDIAVWIDPLDATQEYTENLTHYVTTMMCVAVRGVPVIGVIHRPFTKETVWAWLHKGHSANLDRNIRRKSLQSNRVIVSRSHSGDVFSTVKKAFGADTVVIKAGGAGYKTLTLVEGQSDVYAHKTVIKKWDVCAGNVILGEVNGNMTDARGHNIDYSASGNVKLTNGLLATRQNHDSVVKQWQKIVT